MHFFYACISSISSMLIPHGRVNLAIYALIARLIDTEKSAITILSLYVQKSAKCYCSKKVYKPQIYLVLPRDILFRSCFSTTILSNKNEFRKNAWSIMLS